jgi:hypothetical protein
LDFGLPKQRSGGKTSNVNAIMPGKTQTPINAPIGSRTAQFPFYGGIGFISSIRSGMLPLLGILRLKSKDLVGYTAMQFFVHSRLS